MGSSEGLGVRVAMAWNGSYWVVGGGGGWSERMGDAKNRQRMKDGSHGNGRVNIEISPVLGPGSGRQQRGGYYVLFSFITFLISVITTISFQK